MLLASLWLVWFSPAAADPPPKWQVRHTIELEQPATAVAVGKTWAATGHADGTVRVWSLDTGKELAKLTPPGKPGPIRVLTGWAEGTVLCGIEGEKSGFLWDWSKPNGTRYVRHGFDGFVLDVTADGKKWAVFDGESLRLVLNDLAATGFKPKLSVELVTTGAYRGALKEQLTADPSRVRGHITPDSKGFACYIAPHPTAKQTAPAEDDKAEARQIVFRWDESGELSYSFRRAPQAVAFSADGKWSFSIGNQQEVRNPDGPTGDRYAATGIHNDGVRRGLLLAEIRPFSPSKQDKILNEVAGTCHPWSGALVTGGTDGKVRFWDIPSVLKEARPVRLERHQFGLADKPADVLDAHTDPVRAVLFTPDGLTLVTAGDDKRVLVWRPKP